MITSIRDPQFGDKQATTGFFMNDPSSSPQKPDVVLNYASAEIATPANKPFYKNMTFQVLTAVAIGLLVGYFKPKFGAEMKWFSDAFIRLVKMVVGPIIFLTITIGISKMGDMKKVGRVGARALLYFEVVTTIALLVGLLVVNVLKPGNGISTNISADEKRVIQKDLDKVKTNTATTQPTTSDFLLKVIPDNVVGAFANGDLLQILFFSVLFGSALSALNLHDSGLMASLDHLAEAMFKVVAMVMKFAPLGAFGAMAYTVGQYGLHSLVHLGMLMLGVYITMALFIFVILGGICRFYHFSLWGLLYHIRHELLLVLGTSSSESALPRMMQRMEEMGCNKGIVGMVIPSGYSFNLDGTSIYLSMAIIFLAQAKGIHLPWIEQVKILGILMLTSKGAAAVTGGGLITLSATLATPICTSRGMGPELLAVIVGVDRFMSEARAITNLIGNGVATVVVSKMEKEFDQQKYEAAINADRHAA